MFPLSPIADIRGTSDWRPLWPSSLNWRNTKSGQLCNTPRSGGQDVANCPQGARFLSVQAANKPSGQPGTRQMLRGAGAGSLQR